MLIVEFVRTSTYSVVHRILDPMIPDLGLSARSAVVFPF